jgi:2-polyprenyl-3-methyl-5-hydroxy-6-metoxy-1,4-benzoquinol methylase
MLNWRQKLTRFPPSRMLLRIAETSRSKSIRNLFLPFLTESQSIIDIGAGTCVLSSILQKDGFRVTALDIDNFSVVDDITPRVYDGISMPFQDKTFDVAIIPYVLHHTPNPDLILSEAYRVSHRVIILEDLIGSTLQTAYTYFMDSLLNFEFFGHPHTNRSFENWQKTFSNKNIIHAHPFESKSLFSPFMKHALFVIDSASTRTT